MNQYNGIKQKRKHNNNSKAPAGRLSVIPKTKYMTLGPANYFSIALPQKEYTIHLIKVIRRGTEVDAP